jgi:hypothetical protein
VTTESQRHNCFTNGGNAIQNHAYPEAKGSNPTSALTQSGLVTHSGEIFTTGKSHKKTKEDHWKDFWMFEAGTSQQVAQLHDS